MKIFLDTSALFKRYAEEPGSSQLEELLGLARNVIISPITKIELFSALERRLREKSIKPSEGKTMMEEIASDIPSFSIVDWNENLEKTAIGFVTKYQLKTLDALQLSAGALSGCDLFATSDKILAKAAQKQFDKVLVL